jgi:hypothetical protein
LRFKGDENDEEEAEEEGVGVETFDVGRCEMSSGDGDRYISVAVVDGGVEEVVAGVGVSDREEGTKSCLGERAGVR